MGERVLVACAWVMLVFLAGSAFVFASFREWDLALDAVATASLLGVILWQAYEIRRLKRTHALAYATAQRAYNAAVVARAAIRREPT